MQVSKYRDAQSLFVKPWESNLISVSEGRKELAIFILLR